ncbi:hypothetical protein HHI36_005959 [Cryptolaemus montrouzieri]|uniref:Carboxylesterase type B domain-containing protein n=1 Tax=Cryptolaemus montrouzieri TaxID=559131 RepID=A0ABD2NVM7_9CUCU
MDKLGKYLLYTLTILSCSTYESYSNPYPPSEPIVHTHYGYIRGTTCQSRDGRPFDAYLGIPFAQPPVGELRFKAPKPLKPWNGTFDATKNGPYCIQKNYFFANAQVEGQEDCLYLNVYVPKVINDGKPLPVMVSIHWGGFFAGRGTSDYFGPEYLMDKDVIVVTFNYRLGVLGFLSTLDDEAPGNYALKDQVAVLKWVHRNIRSFNGDPDRVTIFGASAGAGSTHLHIISPLSKGLFHQAISESGSALALWATPLNDVQKQVVAVQAQLVGCNSSDSKSLISCLRKVDARTLVESGDAFKFFSIDPVTPYTLVTETKTKRNPKPFLTKLPVQYVQNGEFSNVPWIIGTNENEGSLRASALVRQSSTRNALNANFTPLMIQEMNYLVSVGTDETKQLDLHSKVQDNYMNGQEFINPDDPANIQGFVNIWSDRAFKYAKYQSVMLHSAMGHSPIWAYSFEYEGQNTFETLWAATNETVPFHWGTSHCDDLLYLFNSPGLFPPVVDGRDREMSEILLDRWTNFAIYGNPQRSSGKNYWHSLNFTGMDNMQNDNLYILNITGSVSGKPIEETMQQGFLKDRMLFWASQQLFENFEGLH